MNGVSAAVITNVERWVAGFSGNITGLTSATLAAGSTGHVRLGVAGNGLNTALTDVTVNANHNFTAFMTAAAFAGATAPSATVHLLAWRRDHRRGPQWWTSGHHRLRVADPSTAEVAPLITSPSTRLPPTRLPSPLPALSS